MLTKVNSIGNIIQCYQNGNYHVTILNDGTKIRYTEENKFNPKFPESIDLKITNRCDMGCQYCHENSTNDGEHCDMGETIKTLDHLPAGIELAIGGGNPLSHPELTPFLQWCKSKGFICNMTVHSSHYDEMDFSLISNGLIHGLGISFRREKTPYSTYKNVVSHVIIGVHSFSDIQNALRMYKKILILGFKTFGRGEKASFPSRTEEIKNNLWKLFQMNGVISFDNLAIEQLGLKDYFYDYAWKEFYMGDDGIFTMYYDAVEQKFGTNSCEKFDSRISSEIGILNFFNDLKGDS